MFVALHIGGCHVATDGVPPFPGLAITGGYTHHRMVRSMSIDGDDAPAAGDAPGVAPGVASCVLVRWDVVIW